MKKETLIGNGIDYLIILLVFVLMFFGGLRFFIVSFIFFGSGGLFEYVIMTRFYGRSKLKISRKDKLWKKIFNGFIWVHYIVPFVASYGTTIYNYKKLGHLTNFFAYLIMFLYVLVAFLLYSRNPSYFVFIVYLIPVISNSWGFLKHRYFAFMPKKK